MSVQRHFPRPGQRLAVLPAFERRKIAVSKEDVQPHYAWAIIEYAFGDSVFYLGSNLVIQGGKESGSPAPGLCVGDDGFGYVPNLSIFDSNKQAF